MSWSAGELGSVGSGCTNYKSVQVLAAFALHTLIPYMHLCLHLYAFIYPQQGVCDLDLGLAT